MFVCDYLSLGLMLEGHFGLFGEQG